MNIRSVLVTTVAVVLLAGCGSATLPRPGGGNAQDDAQAQRIRQLEERVLELQRQAAMTQVELDNLRREVTELRGGTPSTRPTTRRPSSSNPSSASSTRNRDTVSERPSPPVTGEQERRATARGVEGRQGQIEVEDIDPPPVREAEPRRQEVREPVPVRQEPERALELETPQPSAAPGSAGGGGISREAQAQYDRGYTLYHQGRYVDAETAFQQFLQAHDGSELADNAQYWIGESRAARGDSDGALLAFREAVTRFPDGNKVPDSMLKVGDTLADLGDSRRAAEAYRQLIAEFPDTAAAAAAAERLRSLP